MNTNQNLDVSEHIAENFGANASYVESMLSRFRSDPSLVDDEWRAYFAELLGDIANNGNGSPAASTATANPSPATTTLEPQAAASNGASSSPPPSSASTVAASPTSPANVPAMNAAAPARPASTASNASPSAAPVAGAQILRGAALRIVENMEASLNVPTATSNRRVPVKVLEENRIIINQYLQETANGKASFTHIIAWSLVKALKSFPQLNDYYAIVDGNPSRVRREAINIGIAIDTTKKDGSRTLLVPNIKGADAMNFREFLKAYDDTVKRTRDGKIEVKDFQGTTISITNPGTLGTVSSQPRLMEGQAVIIATGAIEYPAEYQAMAPAMLSQLGISKSVNISSTYDHRIIQGAESGAFLKLVHELLIGEHDFYDDMFADLGLSLKPMRWAIDYNPPLLGQEHADDQTRKQAAVFELMSGYRSYGHLVADIDPLHTMQLHDHPTLDIEEHGLTIWDLDREFLTNNLGGVGRATLRKILETLRRAYCGRIGVEYRHIQSTDEKKWLRERIESMTTPIDADIKKQILWKLISAEQFERFLHTKFLGAKRFSVEGCETIIPLLDQLIELGAERGVEDITLGMAHRGRLNVLANVLGHFCERIFTAFEGYVHPNFPADEGDVKYHQGARGERETAFGTTVQLTLSPNPSHLEFVDAPVEGMVRAKQDALPIARDEAWDKALPVLLHGDAAFAGQGIVMETLNLADLKGYRTGGTIHIVINNQIGFTTSPEASRSTIYSTDIAKMTALPIFHVNGDDPEAAYRVMKLALEYRQEFNKDVVIDLVGFRRLGHNETDEPTYTQPVMYARVKEHPGVRAKYAEQLVREKVLTDTEVKELIDERVRRYEAALARSKEAAANRTKQTELNAPMTDEDGSSVVETGIAVNVVERLGQHIAVVPENFHVNPKMVSQLARRAKMGDGSAPLDWAFAEALAFGSLVLEGTHVRLSGQDSGRGTFSHRHSVMYDTKSGERWMPLGDVRPEAGDEHARFEVYDSSLSELAVLGFEYGYTVVAQDALVLWEAQFGDFANGAQVIFDQFIASGEDKWKQTSRLVMLLPHGYEGQGPEHSSARLERFLQACAENNLQVCVPSTPAQYFHLLRRQVRQKHPRPLVVMTPKSLLRLPASFSSRDEITSGGFQPVLDDAEIERREAVNRVVMCGGKVFYDLADARREGETKGRVAILRLEQFYPFPETRIRELLATFPNLKELVWTQEEPHNMGAWTFLESRLRNLLPDNVKLRYVGRAASASPATGSYTTHELEQTKIVQDALKLETQPDEVVTEQVPDVGIGG
ncbi:MAG: multifunctional oxoglutarate decarboxylase/oxoglutarate dehydrogenase thiamine pyrophosphate-binding subunit/dihydrolipoyllysine-residue succinyltransferase subunit [Pyrinomonadaceae bacterium MAG19_C2-C3]|nr:multifunctional oxoglutarate decarboxylase/oxoglutarate dehydrogenase thiamine pyrophosphate-binding subunit/dihydrolipoyllysine-residue succinyltransferase subunit [Pyrinomonadaceae bacterium MAG19_C2-C3]